MKKIIFILLTFVVLRSVSAADECINYSGKWEMNSKFFKIVQAGCSEIKWVNENVLGTPISEVVYLLDGQPHLINGRMLSCSIKNSQWVIEYESSAGQKIVKRFSLEKRPCNLVNPDGSLWLTRETEVDGKIDADACSFWHLQRYQD